MSLSRLCRRIEDTSITWMIAFAALWVVGVGIAAASHFPMQVKAILVGWIALPFIVLIIAAHINNILARRSDGTAR